jgi:hypothetical protein
MSAYGQDKYNFLYADRLIELKGTDYVLSKVENWGKIVKSQYLLFINTRNGQSKRIDFAKDASVHLAEQIKIDSLQINKVLVVARTVNLDNSKRIDWGDPTQIILLSTDGQEKVQLTDDKFFVRDWVINCQTGNIVVRGHYDTNNNGKYDKADDYQILLYDLKTLKLASKVQE